VRPSPRSRRRVGAVMVTAPVASPVASPWEETVAVAFFDVAHVTLSVRFLVLRSA